MWITFKGKILDLVLHRFVQNPPLGFENYKWLQIELQHQHKKIKRTNEKI